MPLNLTSVYARINNLKRNLFFDNTSVLRLLNINTVLLELTSGWYIAKDTVSNLALGAEYTECSIVDEDDSLSTDLEQYLPITTEVQVVNSSGTERFIIAGYFRPRNLTKRWLIRLESTGQRTTT